MLHTLTNHSLYGTALCFCFIFICCGLSQKEHEISNERIKNPSIENANSSQISRNYNFQELSEFFILENRLGEISSLAYDKSTKTFLSNNDESGSFYFLDPKTFKIKSDVEFAKKGDYESIEKVGEDIIICDSSGNLFFYNQSSKETNKVKTALGPKNDVEGLCYDEKSHSLLLACKGEALNISKDKRGEKKSVYRFDMGSKKLIKKPFLSISDKKLKSHLNETYPSLSKSKLKKLKESAKEFAPSGIAIHPESKDYYLISAHSSILLIIDKNKEIKDLIFLNESSIPQPEGICFDQDNNLYISTEGHGFLGKIFKFNYQE